MMISVSLGIPTKLGMLLRLPQSHVFYPSLLFDQAVFMRPPGQRSSTLAAPRRQEIPRVHRHGAATRLCFFMFFDHQVQWAPSPFQVQPDPYGYPWISMDVHECLAAKIIISSHGIQPGNIWGGSHV
jgi:hypothetical protein